MSFEYEKQQQEWLEACNLCGSDNWTPYASKDRYGLGVLSMKCECGLVFLNPRMTPKAYRLFYGKGTYRAMLSKFYGRRIDETTIQKEQKVYAQRVLEFLVPSKITGPGRLLDVGGSTGVVGQTCGEALRLWPTIVEPARAEASQALKAGLQVIEETAENIPESEHGQGYRLVLICQTIDHLLDPMAVLKKMTKLVEPNGLLFVDIVDYRMIAAEKGRQAAMKVDHPFNFEPRTMALMLRDAGWRLVRSLRAPDNVHVNFLCGLA